MSFTSVDFPEPETPVTTESKSERNRDVNIFQIVAVRAENRKRFSIRAAALLRNGNFHLAGKILSCERSGIRGDFFGSTGATR